MLVQSSALRNAVVSQEAISGTEFYHAFRNVWKPIQGPGGGPRPILGVAVSGGVDSMALATLCADMMRRDPPFRPRFHAFVVDHRARSGSREEAEAVVARLHDLGLRSTILTLRWPPGVRPAELSDFETQARRLRYRALGAACRNRTIRFLLLGHHADDQAESILMKIAQLGKHNWTLRPIAGSQVNLPETWGIHGVHESGSREFQVSILERSRRNDGSMVPPFLGSVSSQDQSSHRKDGLQIEDGGVKLYRPLLPFSKKRLEATCLQHEVAWFEDVTNRDVTLTPRNAVRSLLEQRKLPGPLSKDALLQFMSSTENKHAVHEGHARTLFRRAIIHAFDLRSGRLIVRLPKIGKSHQEVPQLFKEKGRAQGKIRATMLLKKLVSLVTPQEHVLLSSLFPMVDWMFPYLADLDHRLDEALMPARMTFQGVLVERMKNPLEPTNSNAQPYNPNNTDSECIWSFTRQPYPRASEPPRIIIPPHHSPAEPSLRESWMRNYDRYLDWSNWQLWDGRYWIRVSNKTDKYLKIRPLRERDMPRIKEQLPPHDFEMLRKTLAAAAPGVVRWTLPVIANSGDGEEILALPSLNVAIDDRPEVMSWAIRYKHVDLGSVRDESCIIR